MEYHSEALDRTTGHLETRSIGNWITVTELGRKHGSGARQVRAILYHMGVLADERGRYRLPRHHEKAGLGKRHDKPRSGHSFDVISPLGQSLIADVWAATVADYEATRKRQSGVSPIVGALSAFKARRSTKMTTQGEVCWVLDHFPDTTHRVVAEVLGVSPGLVSRYAKNRSADRAHWINRKEGSLPEGPETHHPMSFDYLAPER